MSRESHPVLWGSTYNAAEHLPQPHADAPDTAAAKTAAVIAGYLEQSRLVEDQLFSVISSYRRRCTPHARVNVPPFNCVPVVYSVRHLHQQRAQTSREIRGSIQVRGVPFPQ